MSCIDVDFFYFSYTDFNLYCTVIMKLASVLHAAAPELKGESVDK